MSKSSMDSWGKEPGQNPDYLRNCTPKKLRNINPKQIGPIGDPPHISFWKSGFKKSKHHLFQMVPNLAFVGKKGEIIGPGPGQKEIQIPQKNLSNQGLTRFQFPLHTTGSYCATQKRTISMATPSKCTKTGLIRPLLQILSRQLKPGFSQVKIYLKKKIINVWLDSFIFISLFCFHWLLYFFLNVFLPFYVSG